MIGEFGMVFAHCAATVQNGKMHDTREMEQTFTRLSCGADLFLGKNRQYAGHRGDVPKMKK
jgi:hypothetical protein